MKCLTLCFPKKSYQKKYGKLIPPIQSLTRTNDVLSISLLKNDKKKKEEFVKIFSKAFFYYPTYMQMIFDPKKRELFINHLYNVLINHTECIPLVIANAEDDKYYGGAVIFPPGKNITLCAGLRIFSEFHKKWSDEDKGKYKYLGMVKKKGNKITKKYKKAGFYYVLSLAVDPDVHGSGYGGRIMKYVTDLCDVEGRVCVLETENINLLKFYKKFGFEIEGTFDFHEGICNVSTWFMIRQPKKMEI